MTEPRRWPDMDADEARFVDEFGPALTELRDRMQECPPLDMLLAADEDVLPEPAALTVTVHLDRCGICQNTLRDAKGAGVDAPSDMEAERILRRARGASVSSAPTRSIKPPEPRIWMYLTAASVAATLLVGLVALQLLSQNRSLSARVTSAAQTDQASQLASLENRLSAEQSRAAEAESSLAALKRRVDAPEPSLNVPLIDLEPVDALRSTAAKGRVEVPAAAAMVSLVLSASAAAPAADYALEIRDGTDKVVWQGSGLRKSALNTFNLVVPRSILPAGPITLRLYALDQAQRRLAHQYSVQVIVR